MIIIPPIPITDANLVSSNIIEDMPRGTSAVSYNAWSSTASYTTGNTVCHIFTDGLTLDFGGGLQRVETKGGPFFAVYTAKNNNLNKEPSKSTSFGGSGYPGYYSWTCGQYAPAWNSAKTYSPGTVVGRISGGTGAFYMALQTHSNQDPATATTYWRQTTTDSYETWNSGTTYAIDAQVVVFTGQVASVFKSLQNSNTNKNPATETSWWAYLGDTFKIWASGTTYAAGDIVIDLRTHHEYESVQGSNSNHDPTTDAGSWWLDRGASNRWRMFDTINSSATAYAEEIDTTVQMTGFVDTLALTGLIATEVQVICTAGGVDVYDVTFDLTDPSQITNWRKYWFDPLRYKAAVLITDLPTYANMLVRVIITMPGGLAQVGAYYIGMGREIGATVYGASSGLIDYSRKETNEYGDETTLVRRGSTKTGQFKVIVAKEDHDSVFNDLDELRGTVAVYIGSGDYGSTWLPGFYRGVEAVISQPQHSEYNLDLESVA